MDKWVAGRTYYYQVTYKQNRDDGQENVSGNIYSEMDSLVFSNKTKIAIPITKLMVQEEVMKHSFVKTVSIKSELLTRFSGKDRFFKGFRSLTFELFRQSGAFISNMLLCSGVELPVQYN